MKILCFMITPELDNLWEAVHMVYLQQRHMPMSTWGIYESDSGFTVVRVAETERDVETAESMKNATTERGAVGSLATRRQSESYDCKRSGPAGNFYRAVIVRVVSTLGGA